MNLNPHISPDTKRLFLMDYIQKTYPNQQTIWEDYFVPRELMVIPVENRAHLEIL